MKEVKTYLMFKEFGGIDFTKSFENRIKLQKIQYFLQRFGSDNIFKFNYYKRGPYSTEFTDLGFKISNKNFIKEIKSDEHLSNENIKSIEKTQELISDLKNIDVNIDIILKLEFLSALDFLSPKNLDSKNKKSTEKAIKDDKKQIFDLISSIDNYWRLLSKHKLKIFDKNILNNN